MSRRDTIIIAVLINAGLLIVLFASALKSDGQDQEFVSNTPVLSPSSELPVKEEIAPPVAASGDEVDQVLKQFSQGQMAANLAATPEVAAVETAAPEASSPFAQELRAITQPEVPVAAPVSAPEPVVSQWTEVKVKKGDFLDKIARVNHTTVDEIMKANGLTSSRLQIGQVLKIPAKSTKTAPRATAAKSSEAGEKFYTVKNGDNPWTIAVKNHMKVEELLKLNNLDEKKAHHLKPGDKLRIK